MNMIHAHTWSRMQPRRKPSRLSSSMVVLIRWNCTAASCVAVHRVSQLCSGTLPEHGKAAAAAKQAHSVSLRRQQTCDQEVQYEGNESGGDL